MFWNLFKRRTNPLDTYEARPAERLALDGELKAASGEIKRLREAYGDAPVIHYLEALVYHLGAGAEAADLLTHLRPALVPVEGVVFPESKLLEAELLAGSGRTGDAMTRLVALRSERRLPPMLTERIDRLRVQLNRIHGDAGLRLVSTQAEDLAATLLPQGLAIRWRRSDLARLDSFLDDNPRLIADDRERWTSLIGEIAVRANAGRWRLTPTVECRAIELEATSWPVGSAVRDRLARGTPLYASLHLALRTPTHTLDGPGIDVVIEPGVHPAVAIDHVARALLGAGATGLGVLRERPTPEGPVRLPLSFVDKGGVPRVLYFETGAWDEASLTAVRRWVWRLRASSVRDAVITVLSASETPREVAELVRPPSGSPPVPGLPADPRKSGARSATPRSLDEPKLRWLDEKAEVMESLVRATANRRDDKPSDLDTVRRIQETVVQSYSRPASEFSPKQWNGLYGYGALYARILARGARARWTRLADDAQPAAWEMILPGGRLVRPVAAVLKLAQLGVAEADLVAHYIDTKASAERASRDRDPPDS